jgi:hypothetical protein
MWLEDRMRQGVRSQKSGVMSQKKFLFWILNSGFCILFFIGCAAKEEAIKPSLGYFDILPQMTKNKKVIDNLDTKLFIYATYKHWALREAYTNEYARRYQMDASQKERLNSSEKELDQRFNEFFIAVYTPDERWNDFNTPESIWRIYLEDEKGSRVSPIEIKKVDVNSPLIREFYPYLDLWSSGYIIRFPKYMVAAEEPFPGKNASYFKLIITGVVGSAELEWQMR